jgi:hypothetical protein
MGLQACPTGVEAWHIPFMDSKLKKIQQAKQQQQAHL